MNFVIAYINFRHITKNYRPVVHEYVFSQQTVKVKMISFSATTPKVMLGIMDLIHFLAAEIASNLA